MRHEYQHLTSIDELWERREKPLRASGVVDEDAGDLLHVCIRRADVTDANSHKRIP